MSTKTIAIIVLVFVVVAGLGFYFLFPRAENIILDFSKPDQVLLGQPFTLGVSFSNPSDKVINNARVSLVLPEGVAFVGKAPDQRVDGETIGDVGPGGLNHKDFKVIALGNTQTLRHIDAKLIYHLGTNAEFEARGGVDIAVGESAVVLDFSAPQKVFNGENFTITVNYENNTNQDLQNLSVKLVYPSVFQFQKSSIFPTQGNNTWSLGTLPKNQKKSFTVSGLAIGGDGSFFDIKGTVISNLSGQNYALYNQNASIQIASSPLSLSVRVNDSDNYITRIGGELKYIFTYRNNSNVTMQNVTINANLIGEMYDFFTAKTMGSLNSITNTFTWNAGNDAQLLNVVPGSEGEVELIIKVKKDFPIRRLSDKDYILKIKAQIESPTVPQGGTSNRTISVADLETKVAGLLTIQAIDYFRDAASGIVNSGPFPPRVNQPTQYTVHWIVKNYATDMSNVVLDGYLQSNTRFTGKVLSTISSQPTYNPASGEVRWEIGNLPATKGVIGDPVEAVFQLENTPAANQVGTHATILSETRIQGDDNFVGQTLRDSSDVQTTEVPNDTTIGKEDNTIKP